MKWRNRIEEAQTLDELREIARSLLAALSPADDLDNCGRWQPRMLPCLRIYDSDGYQLWEGDAEHAQAVYSALDSQPGVGCLVVVMPVVGDKGVVLWPSDSCGDVHDSAA